MGPVPREAYGKCSMNEAVGIGGDSTLPSLSMKNKETIPSHVIGHWTAGPKLSEETGKRAGRLRQCGGWSGGHSWSLMLHGSLQRPGSPDSKMTPSAGSRRLRGLNPPFLQWLSLRDCPTSPYTIPASPSPAEPMVAGIQECALTHSPALASPQHGDHWDPVTWDEPLVTKRPTGRCYRPYRPTLLSLPTSAGRLCESPRCFFLCLRIEVRPKSTECSGQSGLWGSQLDGSRRTAPNSHWMAPWQPQTSKPEGENPVGGGRTTPQCQTH